MSNLRTVTLAGQAGSVPNNLTDLSDVNIASTADQDALVYDASTNKWKNKNVTVKYVKDSDGANHSHATVENDIDNNVSTGDYAHAEGRGTIANHQAQHVSGEYNVADDSVSTGRGNYAEIVGNGIDDQNRSNARTLDWLGNETLAGGLTLGEGSANEATLTPAGLGTLNGVPARVTTLEGDVADLDTELNDVVLAQASAPSSSDNKLWIDTDTTEEGIEVAEMDDIVAKYNATSTYPVGSFVNYDGHIYKCTTAITTAEAWDSTHWTITTIGDALKSLDAQKQDALTFDNSPTANSTNPVTSGGVYTALDGKQNTLTFDTTPTASSTNPVTSGGIKTALDAKQDNLTVDQTPTASSTNPVTSGGVYTALETKANKEDVTKEISKETARSYMTESISGSIVKFSDGADDIPMEEVRVNFSPIQNLNGYDYPWIGGAGKNLYDNQWMNRGTASSITCSGNSVHIVTDGSTRYMGTGMTSDHDIHGDGSTYYVKFKVKANPTVSSYSRFALRKRSDNVILNSRSITAATSDASYSFSVATTEDFYISFIGNDTNTGSEYATDITIYDIMVSTTDSAFEPYSNICPISGRTGVEVHDENENLIHFPPLDVATHNGVTARINDDGTLTLSGTATAAASNFYSAARSNNYSQAHLGIYPPGTYTVNCFGFIGTNVNDRVVFCARYSDNTQITSSRISGQNGAVADGTGRAVTFTATKPFKIALWICAEAGAVMNCTCKTLMKQGTTASATDYVTPTSKHHAITWADKGTIYGGYVDLVQGKLVSAVDTSTVDKDTFQKLVNYDHVFAIRNNTKLKTWTTENVSCNCMALDNSGSMTSFATKDKVFRYTDYIYVVNQDCSTIEEFNTWARSVDLTFTYPLATPIEYDLDPVTIKSLYGDNVMWSDGDTIEVDYRADTAKSVDSKIEEAKSQTVSVSGTAPTITAAENTRYICGEVVSLSFTPSSSGVSEVIFTAGSTVPVVTLPSTVKMPEWYEIEANHVYEISVLNGVYGAVMSWAV